MNRSYDGPALDGTVQYITERPELDGVDEEDELDREAEDVLYATDPEPPGEERTEGVPVPIVDSFDQPEPPDEPGQSTLSDWGGGPA